MIAKILTHLGARNPKRYIKSTVWIFISKLLSIFVSLAATFYIARTLGPQNLGELNYAISIFNLLAFFGAIASSTVITRDLVKNTEPEKTILGTAWVMMTLGTIVTIICVILLTLYLPHNDVTFYIIGLLCLSQLCASFTVTQYVFYAKADTKKLSLMQLVVHMLVSAAKIFVMTKDQGVVVLAAIMLFDQLLTAAITIFLYKKFTGNKIFEWNFDYSYAKKLAVDSIPFIFISMSIVVSGRIDQIFLKHYVDTAAVGFYSVAVQFTEIWQVLPQILLISLFPALVNAHTSKLSYRKRILALSILLTLYSASASFATYLLAPLLVPLIYGVAFSASIPLLQIYTWSLFGTVAGFLITNVLITENQRQIQIVVGVVPMVINIILNLLWVPHYGGAGAAYATVISYTLAPIIPFFYSSIRQKFSSITVTTDSN